MPELVDQMLFELPYYRYNNTICECLSTNIDFTVPAADFSIRGKNLSSDHVVQLSNRFNEIALDLELDFLLHEPIRDPEIRKRIHETLDETIDKHNKIYQDIDKTRRELPHIEQLPQSDRKPAPEPPKMRETEAHKRIRERARHRTPEQRKQAHERVQQRARSRTPEQRKRGQIRTRKKQVEGMKATMARYQQAKASVSGIFALLGTLRQGLTRKGHQQTQGRSGRKIERDREERER